MLDSLLINNSRIGLIGYGSLGRQIKSFLCSKFNNLTFVIFDDFCSDKEDTILNFNDYKNNIDYIDYFYIGLGYKNLANKEDILNFIPSEKLPTFFHDKSIISPISEIGCGSFIYPGAIIDQNTSTGRACLFNLGVVVSHDSSIGDATFIGPNATICGNVSIGNRCFIGAGSVISNGIKVGDDVIIGAGSVITKNIESKSQIIGNPSKKVQKLNLL